MNTSPAIEDAARKAGSAIADLLLVAIRGGSTSDYSVYEPQIHGELDERQLEFNEDHEAERIVDENDDVTPMFSARGTTDGSQTQYGAPAGTQFHTGAPQPIDNGSSIRLTVAEMYRKGTSLQSAIIMIDGMDTYDSHRRENGMVLLTELKTPAPGEMIYKALVDIDERP